MPEALKKALAATYAKRKAQGKLKGVTKDRYVYGSKVMQDWMKTHGER